MKTTIADDLTSAVFRYVNDEKYLRCDRIAILTVSSGIAVKLFDRRSNAVVLDRKGRGGSISFCKVDENGGTLCGSSGCGIRGVAREMFKNELTLKTNHSGVEIS